MSKATAIRDYERAAALRQAAFDLLDEHIHRGVQDRDAKIITTLQAAADCLGVVERSLHEAANRERFEPSSEVPRERAAQPQNGTQGHDLPLSGEAAAVVALAETVIPFAASRADQAERWLRVMRQHGNVGQALARIGMVSGQLATPATPRPERTDAGPDVAAVAAEAARFAAGRHASTIETVDVLCGVIQRYGSLFDRALYGATSKGPGQLFAALEQSRQFVG